MTNQLTVAPEFATLLAEGERLRAELLSRLESWPLDYDGQFEREDISETNRVAGQELRERVQRWFNVIAVQVLPHTMVERPQLGVLLRQVNAAIGARVFYEELRSESFNMLSLKGSTQVEHNVERIEPPDDVRREVKATMDEVLMIVRSAPSPTRSIVSIGSQSASGSYVPDTAFVFMWMDQNRPELVDVHNVIKDVCREFGITAVRADDVEHQDRITDVILRQIAASEFVIADLTGERPNVYYERGYAHAIGKRPILLRRAGTQLHFDVAGYNVPEYANITDLRQRLRKRLSSMTGRHVDMSGA